MESAIILEERSRRHNRKYQAEEISFRARVDIDKLHTDVRSVPLALIIDVIKQLFQIILNQVTPGLRPTDFIRFCIQADGLDKPLSTHLMRVSDLTVEKILSVVMKVLQSKDQIQLDRSFTVDVITIRRDVGAGRVRKVVNIEVDRLRKKSILAIPSDEDNLCCAKAILFALAHLNKDTRLINTLRNRRSPVLLNRAQNLHQAAGVPLGPCTYLEIGTFENHLNLQIVVISSDNLNRVSFSL